MAYTYSQPVEFPTKGGAAQVTFSASCSSEIKINSYPTWITMSELDVTYNEDGTQTGTFIMTVGPNDDGHEPPEQVVLSINEDVCATKAISVSQKPLGCTCDDVQDVRFITLPTSGINTNTIIGSYNAGNCDHDITAIITGNTLSEQIELTVSNGEISLSYFPESGEYEEQTFRAKFSYKGVPCTDEYEIKQYPELCSCNGLKFFIPRLTVYVPATGTGDNEIVVASADTAIYEDMEHRTGEILTICGTVDAFSTDMIFDGNIEKVVVPDTDHPDLPDHIFEFRGKVKSVSSIGGAIPYTAPINYKYDNGDEVCPYGTNIVATNDICDCDSDFNKIESLRPSIYDDEGRRIVRIFEANNLEEDESGIYYDEILFRLDPQNNSFNYTYEIIENPTGDNGVKMIEDVTGDGREGLRYIHYLKDESQGIKDVCDPFSMYLYSGYIGLFIDKLNPLEIVSEEDFDESIYRDAIIKITRYCDTETEQNLDIGWNSRCISSSTVVLTDDSIQCDTEEVVIRQYQYTLKPPTPCNCSNIESNYIVLYSTSTKYVKYNSTGATWDLTRENFSDTPCGTVDDLTFYLVEINGNDKTYHKLEGESVSFETNDFIVTLKKVYRSSYEVNVIVIEVECKSENNTDMPRTLLYGIAIGYDDSEEPCYIGLTFIQKIRNCLNCDSESSTYVCERIYNRTGYQDFKSDLTMQFSEVYGYYDNPLLIGEINSTGIDDDCEPKYMLSASVVTENAYYITNMPTTGKSISVQYDDGQTPVDNRTTEFKIVVIDEDGNRVCEECSKTVYVTEVKNIVPVNCDSVCTNYSFDSKGFEIELNDKCGTQGDLDEYCIDWNAAAVENGLVIASLQTGFNEDEASCLKYKQVISDRDAEDTTSSIWLSDDLKYYVRIPANETNAPKTYAVNIWVVKLTDELNSCSSKNFLITVKGKEQTD